MRIKRNFGFLLAAVATLSWPSHAQMNMAFTQADLHGLWNPVVGSGASYELNDRATKTNVDLAVVGKEDADGKPGYWIEFTANTPNMGQMVMKNLMVVDGKTVNSTRTIMQMAGRPPMEMPAMMNRGAAQKPQSTDIKTDADLVGSETISTPAGSFTCDHYRAKDQSWDVWVSAKVTPWGVVKLVLDKDRTLVLTKVVTDAKDQITGTPQKFNPADMMRQMGQQPRQ